MKCQSKVPQTVNKNQRHSERIGIRKRNDLLFCTLVGRKKRIKKILQRQVETDKREIQVAFFLVGKIFEIRKNRDREKGKGFAARARMTRAVAQS